MIFFYSTAKLAIPLFCFLTIEPAENYLTVKNLYRKITYSTKRFSESEAIDIKTNVEMSRAAMSIGRFA